jgi:hypothetical protein
MTDPTCSSDEHPASSSAATRIDSDGHNLPGESEDAKAEAATVRRDTGALMRARQAVQRSDAAQAQFAACIAAPARGEPHLPLQGLWGARSGSASSNPRGGVATRAFPDPRGAIVAAGCCLLEDAGDHVRVTWPEGAGFRATMLARVDYDRHCDEGTLVE